MLDTVTRQQDVEHIIDIQTYTKYYSARYYKHLHSHISNTCHLYRQKIHPQSKECAFKNFLRATLNCVFSFLRLLILRGKLLKIPSQSSKRLSENKTGLQSVYEDGVYFLYKCYALVWKFSWFPIKKLINFRNLRRAYDLHPSRMTI